MDSKLRWKDHILAKRQQIEFKHRKMLWLLGRRSKLTLENKILLYKSMIRPIWAYGCQMWACAPNSSIDQIEIIQNLILRQMAGARWYERNADIRAELGLESIETFISRMYSNYEERLHSHPNPEAIALLDWAGDVRRLKRRKPHELSSPFFRNCWLVPLAPHSLCRLLGLSTNNLKLSILIDALYSQFLFASFSPAFLHFLLFN